MLAFIHMSESHEAQFVATNRGVGAACLRTLIPFALSLLVVSACYAVSGVSLGLFFGPILLMTFLVPALTMAEESLASRLLTCAALTSGVSVVWVAAGNLSIFDSARCVGVLGAYILALAGFTALLARVKVAATYAAMFAAVIGFAWLTWPVWLCSWLDGPHAEQIAHWLTVAHPLMATNLILFKRFNFWDRYTLSYQQLTTLNQDVFYTLPKTVAWMILIHGGIGVAGLWRGKIAGGPAHPIAS